MIHGLDRLSTFTCCHFTVAPLEHIVFLHLPTPVRRWWQMQKYNMFKSGYREMTACKCGVAVQTMDHLLRCRLLTNEVSGLLKNYRSDVYEIYEVA